MDDKRKDDSKVKNFDVDEIFPNEIFVVVF